MEPETNKTKALNKEETKGLLSLIEESNIINNKKTNATSNKLKVEEWARIADSFNASIGICRRTPQQLRLKWENLKKNSRKRITAIRMERIKTGGGPPGYFPPDEILDRVATLLGSTGEGLTAMFGGDAEPQIIVNGDGGVGGSAGGAFGVPELKEGSPKPIVLLDSPLPVVIESPQSNSIDLMPVITDATEMTTSMCNEMSRKSIGDGLINRGNIITTPVVPNNKRQFRTGAKRKLIRPDDGRLNRNIALAEYYTVKKMFLESKLDNVRLENERILLENEKLKAEIKRLNENK